MNIKGAVGPSDGICRIQPDKKADNISSPYFLCKHILFGIRADGCETLVRSSKREENHSRFCLIIRIDIPDVATSLVVGIAGKFYVMNWKGHVRPGR